MACSQRLQISDMHCGKRVKVDMRTIKQRENIHFSARCVVCGYKRDYMTNGSIIMPHDLEVKVIYNKDV